MRPKIRRTSLVFQALRILCYVLIVPVLDCMGCHSDFLFKVTRNQLAQTAGGKAQSFNIHGLYFDTMSPENTQDVSGYTLSSFTLSVFTLIQSEAGIERESRRHLVCYSPGIVTDLVEIA